MHIDNQSTAVEQKRHLVIEDFIFSSVCFAFRRICELSIEMWNTNVNANSPLLPVHGYLQTCQPHTQNSFVFVSQSLL